MPHGVGTHNVVLVFIRFEKCGMERIEGNAEKYKEYLLPTLVDIAGVENENNERWKELLEIVFFGRLPAGESLYTAYKYSEKHGVQVRFGEYCKNGKI